MEGLGLAQQVIGLAGRRHPDPALEDRSLLRGGREEDRPLGELGGDLGQHLPDAAQPGPPGRPAACRQQGRGSPQRRKVGLDEAVADASRCGRPPTRLARDRSTSSSTAPATGAWTGGAGETVAGKAPRRAAWLLPCAGVAPVPLPAPRACSGVAGVSPARRDGVRPAALVSALLSSLVTAVIPAAPAIPVAPVALSCLSSLPHLSPTPHGPVSCPSALP